MARRKPTQADLRRLLVLEATRPPDPAADIDALLSGMAEWVAERYGTGVDAVLAAELRDMADDLLTIKVEDMHPHIGTPEAATAMLRGMSKKRLCAALRDGLN